MPDFKLYPRAPQGWHCPQCERIYAPFISECHACNNNRPTVDLDDWQRDFSNPDTVKPSITSEEFNEIGK